MSNTFKFFFDENLSEEIIEEKVPENVAQIIEQYRLLSLEEKIQTRKLINQESLF